MGLDHVRRTYEQLGRDDPLYAVLSRHGHSGGRWDPHEFFATGRAEVAAALEYVRGLGLPLRTGSALDFGCGVGRLTQALAEHFDTVIGVDIAASMVENARAFNRHGERVRYLVNTTDELSVLDDGAFDFVYSSITLQHIPPESAQRYIREFFRVLAPGGVALFNVPDGPTFSAGSLRSSYYALRRGLLRRLWKRLRGKPAVEIHYVPEAQVRRIVQESGGCLVDVVGTFSARSRWGDLRYCAIEPSG